MRATIDQQSFTVAFERRLTASREEVFDAWTRPEQLAQWWDPDGEPLVTCEIDLRPGGTFRFVNRSHSQPFTGTYTIVERPSRLVFEAVGSLGTVTLDTVDGDTRMRVSIRCSSQQQLEQMVQMGIAPNTDRTLDNLVRYMAEPTGRPRQADHA